MYDLYCQGPRGLSTGVSTGWPAVDEHYKVVPGELTLVTGIPNSGKSEWLDALVVNLSRLHGWRVAMCSMENRPVEHARKLMEKYSGKAFCNAEYSAGAALLSEEDVLDALVWIDERLTLIRPPDGGAPDVDWLLARARAAVLRYGIRGLVVDPYNELDHRRPSHVSETEYVSGMLTKVKRFAQAYDCHVWLVAHPRALSNWRGGAPNLYDVSGSAHFINKADNGLVVHRPHAGGGGGARVGAGGGGGGFDDAGGDPFQVQVLVRKVRNKAAGRIGDALLRYDRANGCYYDYYDGGATAAAVE